MKKSKPINAVTLRDACMNQGGVKFGDALTLLQHHKIMGMTYEHKWWISPDTNLKAAIEANKELIERQRRIYAEGWSY